MVHVDLDATNLPEGFVQAPAGSPAVYEQYASSDPTFVEPFSIGFAWRPAHLLATRGISPDQYITVAVSVSDDARFSEMWTSLSRKDAAWHAEIDGLIGAVPPSIDGTGMAWIRQGSAHATITAMGIADDDFVSFVSGLRIEIF
jgi:hypothetical protein